jgi:hypothetical protein
MMLEKHGESDVYLRWTAGAVLLAAIAGCGPAVRPEELGHVVYGESNLPRPK